MAAPPLPIVWGISATVERFNDAMKGAKDRTTLPNVEVDNARVQASGLLRTQSRSISQTRPVPSRPCLRGRRRRPAARRRSFGRTTQARRIFLNRLVRCSSSRTRTSPRPPRIKKLLDTIYDEWKEAPACGSTP